MVDGGPVCGLIDGVSWMGVSVRCSEERGQWRVPGGVPWFGFPGTGPLEGLLGGSQEGAIRGFLRGGFIWGSLDGVPWTESLGGCHLVAVS
jgi:hypothetical protein